MRDSKSQFKATFWVLFLDIINNFLQSLETLNEQFVNWFVNKCVFSDCKSKKELESIEELFYHKSEFKDKFSIETDPFSDLIQTQSGEKSVKLQKSTSNVRNTKNRWA